MLVSVFALISMGVFAQAGTGANTVFTFSWNDAGGSNQTAIITGFVTGATKGDITIPATVQYPKTEGAAATTFKVTAIDAGAFLKETAITKVTFASANLVTIGNSAFSGCTNLAAVDFTAATGVTTIGTNAFAGTKITSLDLSKTKLVTVNNLFDTKWPVAGVAPTYYTQAECDAWNIAANLPGIKDEENGDNIDADDANDYNATLSGAVKIDGTGTLAAATAAAWNANYTYISYIDADNNVKALPINGTTKLSAAQADAYNATLDWALDLTGNTTATDDNPSALQIALWKTYFPTETAIADDGTGYTEAQAKAFNAKLPGAVANDGTGTLDATTAANWNTANCKTSAAIDALPNNATLAANILTADQAKAYNATLTGALAAGAIDAETAQKWNDAVLTVRTGDLAAKQAGYRTTTYPEKTAGVAEVKEVACPLTSLALPKTWTSIVEGAFQNCPKLAEISLIPEDQTAANNQTINDYAFLGATVTSLDFSKTKVASIPGNLLADGIKVETNSILTTVKLNDKITALNNAFSGFTALSSIDLENDSKLVALGVAEFAGCTALTSINLQNITTLGAGVFSASGLTSVSLPKAITVIPEEAFWLCEDLETVTFAANYDALNPFTKIEEYAFAYSGIKSIIVPNVMPNDAADGVDNFAFMGCASLTDFTYAPAAATAAVVNADAFKRCSNVKFHTSLEYVTANAVAPTNTTYDYALPEAATKKFEGITAYKTNANKFYVKWKGTETIKVKKSDAKVYDAYLDSDNTLNMIQYKVEGGYYHIFAGNAALILTDNAELTYETSAHATGTSFVDLVAGLASALKMNNAAATTRAALEKLAPAGTEVFVWTNSATKGVGFGKFTGTNIPVGTLYAYAAEDEAGAPRINWFDENGNMEDAPADVTGIETVATDKEQNGVLYNMQGIRVNNAQKGLYIKNGKKFIVK